MSKPNKVVEMLQELDKNAIEAGCENTMYAEEEDGIWRIVDNYERMNTIFAYDPSQDRWFYQKMYGDFYDDENLVSIGDPWPRISKPMKGNHREALANASCLYTG